MMNSNSQDVQKPSYKFSYVQIGVNEVLHIVKMVSAQTYLNQKIKMKQFDLSTGSKDV